MNKNTNDYNALLSQKSKIVVFVASFIQIKTTEIPAFPGFYQMNWCKIDFDGLCKQKWAFIPSNTLLKIPQNLLDY